MYRSLWNSTPDKGDHQIFSTTACFPESRMTTLPDGENSLRLC